MHSEKDHDWEAMVGRQAEPPYYPSWGSMPGPETRRGEWRAWLVIGIVMAFLALLWWVTR